MAVAAHEDARRAGADFGRRFFEERPLPWPDPASTEPGGERRTIGQWETGSYTAEVKAAMTASFSAAIAEEGPAATARWADDEAKDLWREAARMEFGQRLLEVSRFAAPSGRG